MNPHYRPDGTRGKPTGVYCLQRSTNYTAYIIQTGVVEAVTRVHIQTETDTIETNLSATNSPYRNGSVSINIVDGTTVTAKQFDPQWALFTKPPQIGSPILPQDWFTVPRISPMTRSLNMSQELWALKAQTPRFCGIADYSITKPLGSNKLDQYDKFRTQRSVYFRHVNIDSTRMVDSRYVPIIVDNQYPSD